jgi:hypothetical protein
MIYAALAIELLRHECITYHHTCFFLKTSNTNPSNLSERPLDIYQKRQKKKVENL